MIPVGDIPLRPIDTTIPPGVQFRSWSPTYEEEEQILAMQRAMPGVTGLPTSPIWAGEERPNFWGGMTPRLPWELERQQTNAKPAVQVPNTGTLNPGARDREMSVTPNSSGSPDERGRAVVTVAPAQTENPMDKYPYLKGIRNDTTPTDGPYESFGDMRRDIEMPNGTWIFSTYDGKKTWKYVPKLSLPNTTSGNSGWAYPRYVYGGGGGGGYQYNAPAKPWYMELATWKIG